MAGLLYLLRVGPLRGLLALSAGAFILMAVLDWPAIMVGLCGRPSLAGAAPLVAATWSPGATLAAWIVMVAAMMPPLLGPQIAHVWVSSLAARRVRALAGFGLGYLLTWLAAGLVLVPAALALRLIAAPPVATLGLAAIALAWSASPPAQAARNRCHRLRPIRAFGATADADCLAQGLASGMPCVAACWPWMLLTLVAAGPHLAIMMGVTGLVFLERLAPPAPAAWRPPPALRMAATLIGVRKLWAAKPQGMGGAC